MNHKMFQFEYLPNEILILIYKYFDAKDLFRAFYNLNSRFNRLIQSLNYLSLTLLKYDANQINDCYQYAHYIYTLRIDYPVNIDLNCFTNIRRLILMSPTSNQLKQLVLNDLPYLEHLTIGYEHFLFSYYISDVCKKIFFNEFPSLQSCYLYEPRITEIIPQLMQQSHIRILKMDNVDLLTYKNILELCPNLNHFQFCVISQIDEQYQMPVHVNLKQIIIKFQNLIKRLGDSTICQYLSCVPYVEKLSIHEISFDTNIEQYLDYHWFALIINKHLKSLEQFKYYLYAYGVKQSNDILIDRIKNSFKIIHRKNNNSQLLLKFS